MITVGMNYEILPGKQAEFEAVFEKVLTVMGRMDGHVTTRLYRAVADPQSYMIHSEWRDRPSFEAFIASPQFKGVTEWGKASILAARPRHEIYESGSATGAARPATCPVAH